MSAPVWRMSSCEHQLRSDSAALDFCCTGQVNMEQLTWMNDPPFPITTPIEAWGIRSLSTRCVGSTGCLALSTRALLMSFCASRTDGSVPAMVHMRSRVPGITSSMADIRILQRRQLRSRMAARMVLACARTWRQSPS